MNNLIGITRFFILKKVVILQRISADYRYPFYEKLYFTLKEQDIELSVIYGQHSKFEKADKITILDYSRIIKNRYLYFGNRFLVYQPAIKYLINADLIIVQQATRNLINYLLSLGRKVFRYKLAYWGHGRNLQAIGRNTLSERLKRFYSLHVDYWFAYNDFSAEIVRKLGYPEEKITPVNNTIDTRESIRVFESITGDQRAESRKEYGVDANFPVGIFCSRLYRGKRLDFLIQCVREVKGCVADFHFFVIGDGPDADIIKEFAKKESEWFHYVGPGYGEKKIRFFDLADFQLMPGPVGLHIVESFAFLKPLVTTEQKTHGPEIAYLKNGVNGVMTEDSADVYVSEILRMIHDRSYREKLVEGCKKARAKYTNENMVACFSKGIRDALFLKGEM